MASRFWGAAAGVFDRAFVAAIDAKSRRDRARTDAMPHAARLGALAAAERLYAGASLFPDPGPCAPTLVPIRDGVWEASWPSASTPFLAEVSAQWLARVENRTARARLYGRSLPGTRPAIVLLHGYLGGQWLFEEQAWPIAWFVRLGLDVVLPLLPLHGTRGTAQRGAPGFPSSDARLTNEGFRQAITDVRSIASWLRERGAPAVGAMGMSLGGYTSALAATVMDLDFVAPMIPLASIADFAREQGRLTDGPDGALEHAALERAYVAVSPLARAPRVAPSRALVIAAEQDRITPLSHARRLAEHFGSELVTIPGGHLLQLGRREGFRALRRLLERERIIAPRP